MGSSLPMEAQETSRAISADYEAAKEAYQKAQDEARRPIQERYLAKLREARAQAVSKGYTKLVTTLDEEIHALEGVLGLVEAPPPPAEPVEADFTQGTFEGPVAVREKTGALHGFTSRRDRATIPVTLEQDQHYRVELTYRSNDHGRMRFVVGEKEFLPDLKDTSETKKPVTLPLGTVTAPGPTTVIISLPLHRSKPFVELQALRFIPEP